MSQALSLAAASTDAAVLAERLRLEGGWTVQPDTLQDAPTRGYAVSVPGHEIVTSLDAPTLARDIRATLDAAADSRAYAGAWLDDDGRVYLDVSHVVPDRADALALADAGDQLAIFDLARGEEIRVA